MFLLLNESCSWVTFYHSVHRVLIIHSPFQSPHSEFYIPLFSPSIAVLFHPSQVKEKTEEILNRLVKFKSITSRPIQGNQSLHHCVFDSSFIKSVSPILLIFLSLLCLMSILHLISTIRNNLKVIPNHSHFLSTYFPHSSSSSSHKLFSILPILLLIAIHPHYHYYSLIYSHSSSSYTHCYIF